MDLTRGTLPAGHTGQRPRMSVADMTRGAPGIKWVGTRDAAQASMVPRKAVNGSTTEERLGHESPSVPRLGSGLRSRAYGFFTAVSKATDRPTGPLMVGQPAGKGYTAVSPAAWREPVPHQGSIT